MGIILYYMCFSSLPYEQIDDLELLRREITSHDSIAASRLHAAFRQRPDIPVELKQVIISLLSPDPLKRPSCESILTLIDMTRSALGKTGLNGFKASWLWY